MANAWVNFFHSLTEASYGERGAQVFTGRSNQAHRASAAVGANAANPTVIALVGGTNYAEICPDADIFACIMPTGSSEEEIAAAAFRVKAIGSGIAYSRPGFDDKTEYSLYMWSA